MPGWLSPEVLYCPLPVITELGSSALTMTSAPYCDPILAHVQILALLTMADLIYSQLISCLVKPCITDFPWMLSDMVPDTGTECFQGLSVGTKEKRGIAIVDCCSLFYICEHTVAVFRHTRRGHQTPLQMVVSHHVVAGN